MRHKYFCIQIFLVAALCGQSLGQLGQAPEINPNSNSIPVVTFQARKYFKINSNFLLMLQEDGYTTADSWAYFNGTITVFESLEIII